MTIFLARIFLVLSSLLVAIIICEIIYEKFFYREEELLHGYTNTLFYKPYPYIMYKATPLEFSTFNDENNKPVFINRNGYRGQVPKKEKNNKEFRIFILGGSTVFGAENDIVSEIEKVFHTNGFKHVKAYNYGTPSSNAGQNLARLLYEIVDYSPDLVISYEGANDFEHPFFADPRPGYPFNFFIHEANPLYTKTLKNYPLLPTLLYASSIVRENFDMYFVNAFGQTDELQKKVGHMTPPWYQDIVDTFWNHLLKTQHLSRSYGADYIAIFQPMVYYKEPRIGKERNASLGINYSDMERLRELLRQKAANDTKLNFYDASDVFDGHSREVFKDTVHVDTTDRVFIAKYFYKLIKSCKHCKNAQKLFKK